MGFKIALAAGVLGTSLAVTSTPALAQDRYLGEVILVGHNFCPRGTLPADGQLLPISANTALFSLYGTMYGGDGRTTFALPDLRGRTPVGVGGSSGREPGRVGGTAGSAGSQGHASGQSTSATSFVAMRYCIVSAGIFPSRR